MTFRRLGGFVIATLLMTGTALAGEEPFGMDFDGWRFTQADEQNNRINCRAIHGNNLMSKSTNGLTYVSTRSTIGQGTFEDSTVIVGGSAELVKAWSGGVGGRLVFYVDEYVLEQIAMNRGFSWRVAVGGGIDSGSVQLNNSAVSALERLLECVAANGG